MSISWIASCLRMANISSCLRMVLAFSTPFSSANETSSAGVFALRSWSFISRIGVVLWSNLEKGCEVALRKSGHEKGRSAGLSEESAGEASNLMRWPVQGRNRNATTSACVGWDFGNIENRPTFRKEVKYLKFWQRHCLKRLHHYQDNDQDHQNSRYLIDNPVEFLTPPVVIAGEILDASGK